MIRIHKVSPSWLGCSTIKVQARVNVGAWQVQWAPPEAVSVLPHCLLYLYHVERRPPMMDFIGPLLSFLRCKSWHSLGLPKSEAN